MKKRIILSCLLFICLTGYAQNNHSGTKFSLKISNLATIFNNNTLEEPFYYSQIYHRSQFFKPTLSITWQKSKFHYHELEITNIQINKLEKGKETIPGPTGDPMPAIDLSKTHLSLRYEYVLKFKSDKNWQAELGFGINPYFIQLKKIPQSTVFNYETNRFLGSRINLIPRITYRVNHKIALDFNIPINFYDFNSHSREIRDASKEFKNQTKTNFEGTFLPKVLNLRIGLAYTF